MRITTIPSIPRMPSLLWRGVSGGGVDPAFNVTNGGEGVTHMGIQVTHTPDIDPMLMVYTDGSVVVNSGEIVTNGA